MGPCQTTTAQMRRTLEQNHCDKRPYTTKPRTPKKHSITSPLLFARHLAIVRYYCPSLTIVRSPWSRNLTLLVRLNTIGYVLLLMVVLAEVLRVDRLLRGCGGRRRHLFCVGVEFVGWRPALLSGDHVPAAVGE